MYFPSDIYPNYDIHLVKLSENKLTFHIYQYPYTQPKKNQYKAYVNIQKVTIMYAINKGFTYATIIFVAQLIFTADIIVYFLSCFVCEEKV